MLGETPDRTRQTVLRLLAQRVARRAARLDQTYRHHLYLDEQQQAQMLTEHKKALVDQAEAEESNRVTLEAEDLRRRQRQWDEDRGFTPWPDDASDPNEDL